MHRVERAVRLRNRVLGRGNARDKHQEAKREEVLMSRSVDLFIDADLPLDELAGALGVQLGSPLTRFTRSQAKP